MNYTYVISRYAVVILVTIKELRKPASHSFSTVSKNWKSFLRLNRTLCVGFLQYNNLTRNQKSFDYARMKNDYTFQIK